MQLVVSSRSSRHSPPCKTVVFAYKYIDDLIAFFNRCKKGLKPGGMIFVKENNAKVGIVIDEEDSSMTRSDLVWKEMFEKAGLKLLREDTQKGFPSGLFAVKMYALEPSP